MKSDPCNRRLTCFMLTQMHIKAACIHQDELLENLHVSHTVGYNDRVILTEHFGYTSSGNLKGFPRDRTVSPATPVRNLQQTAIATFFMTIYSIRIVLPHSAIDNDHTDIESHENL